MPKKGASPEHNWSLAFSPRKSRPRPKIFQEDRRTLQNILVDSMKDYKYKHGEIFKRMKVTTFVQLILHIAEFEYREDHTHQNNTDTPFRPDTADLEVDKIQREAGGGGGGGGGASGSMISPRKLDTNRSTREDRLMGKANGTCSSRRPLINSHTCPYLLLDLRDRDDFHTCHIITAKNYSSPTLARAINFESPEMLRYKNQDGKIIILYDTDETLTARAATTLVERGYNNVFVLTGGLKLAYKLFPNGLLTGMVPGALLEQGGGPQATQGRHRTGGKPATDRGPAGRNDFTQDDLNCLHIYIDNALMDTSSGSRLTQRPRGPPRRAGSSISGLSSSTTTTGTGRQPFKP